MLSIKSVRLLASLMMLTSVSACETITLFREKTPTSFCARYYDKQHPPVWIFAEDMKIDVEQKTDLLLVWEVECGIG